MDLFNFNKDNGVGVAKKHYHIGSYKKAYNKTHYCYQCGLPLQIITNYIEIRNGVIEPKGIHFIDDNISILNNKFSSIKYDYDLLFCNNCNYEIDFCTQISLEEINKCMKIIAFKYWKQNNTIIFSYYFVKSNGDIQTNVDNFNGVRYMAIDMLNEGKTQTIYEAPLDVHKIFHQPVYFKFNKIKFKAIISKYMKGQKNDK